MANSISTGSKITRKPSKLMTNERTAPKGMRLSPNGLNASPIRAKPAKGKPRKGRK